MRNEKTDSKDNDVFDTGGHCVAIERLALLISKIEPHHKRGKDLIIGTK